MITGAHFLIYSPDADVDREFLGRVFGFPAVDVGEGWLIFALPPAELAVHPAEERIAQQHARHDLLGCVLYLMCDDLGREMAALERKGVACSPPQMAGWGTSTTLALPSGGRVGLYEARHPSPVARGNAESP